MRPARPDKWLGIVGVLLLLGATIVASKNHETTSSTRRGAGLESMWFGLQAILGLEEPEDAGLLLPARLLAFAGVVLLAFWGWRKARRGSAAPPRRPAA